MRYKSRVIFLGVGLFSTAIMFPFYGQAPATVSNQVALQAAPASVTSQVSSSADDAEEPIGGGLTDLNSSDLELGADGTTSQWVAMRFNNLTLPNGASILNAYVEFEVDETGSGSTSILIQGQAIDHAPALTNTNNNLSSRARTTAQVAWNNIPAWTVLDAKWQTPDLAPIIQEIINRPGWTSGNSIVLLVSGSGRRTAEAYDGEIPAAPKLVIQYAVGATLTPGPTATPTFTSTSTSTATNTATASITLTPTGTGTPTRTPPPTATPISSVTSTATATRTPTASATPSPTRTMTGTPADTALPSPGPTQAPDLIFADSFESGNLSAWSSNFTDGGDLNVSSSAALFGMYGLRAVIDDNNAIYVTDDSPNAETRYRARFYFDPNSITMSSSNDYYIFYGYAGTSTQVLRIEFRYSGTSYQLRAGLRTDSSSWTNSGWFNISDGPHFIELDWRASTASSANNGGLMFWMDGTQRASLTGVDNDTRRIDRIRLGAVSGINSGTRGTTYFDALESRQQTYIGP